MPATHFDSKEQSVEKEQSYLQESALISSEEDAGNEVEEILTLEITKPAAKLQYSHGTWCQNHIDPSELSLVSEFNAHLISQAESRTGILGKGFVCLQCSKARHIQAHTFTCQKLKCTSS